MNDGDDEEEIRNLPAGKLKRSPDTRVIHAFLGLHPLKDISIVMHLQPTMPNQASPALLISSMHNCLSSEAFVAKSING